MNSTLLAVLVAGLFATSLVVMFLCFAGHLKDFEFKSKLQGPAVPPVLFVAAIVFVVGLFFTRLVPVALALAVLTYAIPLVYQQSRKQKETLERMDAIAVFAQSLADSVSGGNSLTAALQVAAHNPPTAIADSVKRLRLQLESEPFESCLMQFADEVNHAAADRLVAHLIQANKFAGGRLSMMLRRVSQVLNDYIVTSRKIETSRRRQEFEIKGLSFILVGLMLLLLLTAPDMLEVFSRDWSGQIKLTVVFGLVFSGWFFANKYTRALHEHDFRIKRAADANGLGDSS